MRGKKKRKTSSSREDGSGGEEEEEERAGDAPAPAPPLVDAVAETAATSVEETTVIETMVGEENKGKSEEEEVEEFYEPALVLKTDSGTEVDLTKLRSSKDVAPEMGGYLKKLQQQLSILLGGGNRTSDCRIEFFFRKTMYCYIIQRILRDDISFSTAFELLFHLLVGTVNKRVTPIKCLSRTRLPLRASDRSISTVSNTFQTLSWRLLLNLYPSTLFLW